MAYCLLLGRIWLPTLNGDYGLTAGDGLEAVGSLVFGGEARPRELKATLPIHGEWEDADPRAVADRLRRQLEALLENEAARLPAVFMRWRPFPDRDAWLAIGGGDFTDAEGGPTFADYKLELDVRRAGTPATHRIGRRLHRIDRRLSTTPRDYLGRLYSSEFAALPSLPLHFIPPGARELVGAAGALLSPVGVRAGLGGSSLVLPSRPAEELVTFERPPAAIAGGGGDVVIYDRRGKADTGAAVGLAGPRLARFDGPNGKGGDLSSMLNVTVSNDGSTTIAEGRRREDGSWVLYVRVGRSDVAVLVARDLTGTGGFPVTPGGVVGVRARVNSIQSGGSQSVRIYWFKADGSASATASTNVSGQGALGPFTGLLDFGGGGIAVPADAAFACLAWAKTNNGVAGTWEFEVEDWTIVAGAASTPAFLHGDERGRRYLGDPGLSLNALEPQAASGWEEVYGPAQPLTPGDVPVVENGLVRVRRVGVVNVNDGVFALDTWSASSLAWVERGRLTAYIDAPSGTASILNTLERADVVEWTPERAVVRIALSRAGNGRGELYVTLQRGWTGPRLELYTRRYDGTLCGACVRYSPAGVANDGMIAVRPGSTLPLASDDPLATWASSDRGAFGPTVENWSALARVDNAAPALAVAVLQEAARIVTRDDTFGYVDNRRAMNVEYRLASVTSAPGYLSVHLGFAVSHFAEAELARTGALTGTIVADASAVGAAGANAVETTVAANGSSITRRTAAELAAAGVTPGVYGVWARIRAGEAGMTASYQAIATAGSSPTIVTTTSQTWAWAYLGEVTLDAASNFAINAWRSVGATGAARIDRWIMIALDRRDATDPDYDGARDLAQAELADSRQDLALVTR